jgi:alcohol dehydrogenase
VPASFQLSEDIIAPDGTIANIGMNGMTIDLHMERFWSHSITTTTRVVDTVTTPRLLKTFAARSIEPKKPQFDLEGILDACDGWSRHANSPLEGHHRGLNVMATNTGINRYTTLWDEDWP